MNDSSSFLQLFSKSIFKPKMVLALIEERAQSKNNQKHITHTYSYDYSSINDFFKEEFPDGDFEEYESEIRIIDENVQNFLKELENKKFPSKEKPYPIEYSINSDSRKFLYFLCRLIKPKNIVETGVAYGISSLYILNALEKNNSGKLYSIDSIFRPWQTTQMIGAAIPDNLKIRWSLSIGKSTEKLDKVFKEAIETDIFIHDSLHTYQNMMFEFNLAAKKIKKNGLIISDDVIGNDSFYDFSKEFNLKNTLIKVDEGSGLGIVRKN